MKKENIATHLSVIFLIVFFIVAAIKDPTQKFILPLIAITITSWVILTSKRCCYQE